MAKRKVKRKSRAIIRDDFHMLDNLTTVQKYFKYVSRMDKANLREKEPPLGKIMKLWSPKGALKITGPRPIGEQVFANEKELMGFYEDRAVGISETFRRMVVSMAGAKAVAVKSARSGESRAVANGVRHLLTTQGEGMSVPFSHDFTFDDDGLITALSIHIGKASPSPIAPAGRLGIQDMGKLAALAWMVA